MRQWFTAKELANMMLPGLPKSKSGLIRFAAKAGWEWQLTVGVGGGANEYHISNLPLEARHALEAQLATEMLTRLGDAPGQLRPAGLALPNVPLTHTQREKAGARSTVVNAIDALRAHGITQVAAMTTLLTEAETGQLAALNPVLDKALRLCKDERGRGGQSPYPSIRSLKRYLGKKPDELIPSGKRPLTVPEWANDFLVCWQRPEKPTVEHAYRSFLERWEDDEAPPSIYAVRRFIKKMGNVARERGRMGPRELKNIMPFVRRDFSKLKPADIYSADGHAFDAEVQHPLHGRPFRPEVTTWIDIATRRTVGVSVALAESGIAVLDALIDSCTKAVPAVIYVDNGSGYCNAMLKDEATGVMVRLGSEMTHSLPYNSQARGVIERVHQTLWVDGAKELPGYMGADMDREARQQQFKLSRQALKGGRQTLVPWADFMQWVRDRVEWYNERPHTSLHRISDGSGKRRHITPNEAWQQHLDSGWKPDVLSADEAAIVFRPRVTRTVQRGEIQVFANRYFSRELTEWNREEVQVAYDVNNADFIWVFDIDGDRLICKAEWNANRTDYMQMPFIEQAREKRYQARLRRVDAKRQEVEEERRGRSLLEHDGELSLDVLGTVDGQLLRQQMSRPGEPEPIDPPLSKLDGMTMTQRYVLHCSYSKGEKAVPDEHREWLESYKGTHEYRVMKSRNEEFEEAGPAAPIR